MMIVSNFEMDGISAIKYSEKNIYVLKCKNETLNAISHYRMAPRTPSKLSVPSFCLCK